MRAFATMLVCAAVCGAAATAVANPAGAPAAALSADDRKACDAVIDAAVAAGFPDGTGASFYAGRVTVAATFDPGKVAPQLPSDRSGMQETHANSNDVTYAYQLDGLHAKLADGTWVLSMRYRFKPAAGDRVDVTEATALNLATLTADAAADRPGFDAATKAAGWLAKVPAADRAKAEAVMNRYVPVTSYLRTNPDDVAPAVLLLAKAGWADAAEVSQVVAHARSRSYWQLRPWTTPDAAFDPTGKYATAKDDEAAWKAAHDTFPIEPPADALRRSVFRWCRAQITVPDPEDGMMPPAVAAAACAAVVDPGDPQHNGPRIDALLAGSKVPAKRAADAPLADRLASWEAGRRMPKMTVTGGGGANPSIGTSFDVSKPAYEPTKADLDALVDLLADDRPSRFDDFAGPRTVGDNAWRAVAELVEKDPRTLAGYPTDHPWTADERKAAAAAAVQAWWKDHGKDLTDK